MNKFPALFCVIMVIGTGLAVAQEPAPPMPKFASTTTAPVLFRYKHRTDQNVDFNLDMAITVSLSMSGEWSEVMSMAIDMTGNYVVRDVSRDGNARIDYVFSGMTVDVGGLYNAHYDSADPASSPEEFGDLGFFVNNPIQYTIAPRGTLLASDISAITRAMEQAGRDVIAGDIEKQFSEYTKSSFVQLAEKPVGEGDVYEAGEIRTAIAGLGDFAMKTSYRVAAVSADRKQAVLEPLVRFELSETDMSKSGMEGWILFDLEKGNVAASYGKLHLEFELAQGEAAYPVLADSLIKYQADF